MLAGVNAPRALYTCDQVAGFVPAVDAAGFPVPPPCSYLLEGGEGLAVYRHPLTLLEQDEHLWGTWFRFRDTSQRDLTLADRRRFSHFELRLWLDLCVYAERKRIAELQDRPPPGASDKPKQRFHTMRSLAAAAAQEGLAS